MQSTKPTNGPQRQTHKFSIGPQRQTHPLIWCAAIICAIIAVAVIFGGIVVFVVYIAIHPRMPFISVQFAHLDAWQFDPAGLLQIQVTLYIHAANDNRRAHATFSDTKFDFSFTGVKLAELHANPFEVRKNSSIDMRYIVQSAPIPMDPERMQFVASALSQDRITFGLKGSSRTQWRLWSLGSAKFMCHLDCQLRFHYRNGSYIPSRCTSKAK